MSRVQGKGLEYIYMYVFMYMVQIQGKKYRYRAGGAGYREKGTIIVISAYTVFFTTPNHISNCLLGYVHKSNIQVVLLSV